MKEGKPLIIIDNTNIRLWEMRKYVEAGEQFSYEIKIQQADSPWAFNYRQCAKKNNHGVPEMSVKNMCDNYETFVSLQQIKTAKDSRRRGK